MILMDWIFIGLVAFIVLMNAYIFFNRPASNDSTSIRSMQRLND